MDLELYGVSGLKIAPNCMFFKEFVPGDWDFVVDTGTVWGKMRFQVKNPPVDVCCVMAATMESFWNCERMRLQVLYKESGGCSLSDINLVDKQFELWGNVCHVVHGLLIDGKL